MASKPSFPTALLRTCTSILGRRTSQLQLHASRLLNVELQSQSPSAWARHFEDVTRGIERMGGSARLQPIPIRVQSQPSFGQRRWNSTDSSKVKQLEFEDVLAILETPSDSRLLIDVREPDEFEANTIPTAINLPIFSQPEALLLDEEDFQDRFGFAKPPRNKEVIFFCKAGVRCSTAAKFARRAGYENVGEYRGSWLDWKRNGGPGTKTPSAPGGKGEAQLPVQETKPVRGKGDSGEEDLGPQGKPPYHNAPKGL